MGGAIPGATSGTRAGRTRSARALAGAAAERCIDGGPPLVAPAAQELIHFFSSTRCKRSARVLHGG